MKNIALMSGIVLALGLGAGGVSAEPFALGASEMDQVNAGCRRSCRGNDTTRYINIDKNIDYDARFDADVNVDVDIEDTFAGAESFADAYGNNTFTETVTEALAIDNTLSSSYSQATAGAD